MSWLNEHKRLFRFAFLLLFVVALVGPWFYEDDGVPPPQYCDERFVLVAEDRCATLISGVRVIGWLPLVLVSVPRMLFAGELRTWLSLPYSIALTALIVPFLSNLRHLARDKALPARGSYRAILAIATLAGTSWPLFIGYIDRPLTFPLFWGIWLYVATALVALAFELGLARRSPPSSAPQTVLPTVE